MFNLSIWVQLFFQLLDLHYQNETIGSPRTDTQQHASVKTTTGAGKLILGYVVAEMRRKSGAFLPSI